LRGNPKQKIRFFEKVRKTGELKVYELFKRRFNDEEAHLVIEYFESKAEETINQKKDVFLSKNDKVEIIEKLASLETRLTMRMFYFWIGQVAVIAGMLAYFFHTAR
jgi:hypothetical protein